MCGRYAVYGPSKGPKEYGVGHEDWPAFAEHFNAAPSLELPVIRRAPDGSRRVCHLMRWGLVPHWAEDLAIGVKLTNARAETVSSKPAFRAAYRKRRCLIPSGGFYEWQTVAGERKQPWFIQAGGGAMAMAGLWESRTMPDGSVLRTFCVITTTANELVAPIHDRMPVILPQSAWDDWLDPETPQPIIDALLVPYPAELMTAHRVSYAVGNARNEGPGLIDPIGTGDEDE